MSEQALNCPSEREFRRADFIGGIPVVLADGQEWFFAEPRIRLVPADTPLGYELYLALDDHGKFQGLVDRYQELLSMDRETFANATDEFIAIELRMARMMLERNYELTLPQMQKILQFSHDAEADPVANEIRRNVVRVINGDVPKPSAGGDGLSASPSAR